MIATKYNGTYKQNEIRRINSDKSFHFDLIEIV